MLINHLYFSVNCLFVSFANFSVCWWGVCVVGCMIMLRKYSSHSLLFLKPGMYLIFIVYSFSMQLGDCLLFFFQLLTYCELYQQIFPIFAKIHWVSLFLFFQYTSLFCCKYFIYDFMCIFINVSRLQSSCVICLSGFGICVMLALLKKKTSFFVQEHVKSITLVLFKLFLWNFPGLNFFHYSFV